MTALAPLAGSIVEDGGKPLTAAGGFPWGFVIMTLLFAACFLLYRSMRKHLQRVPDSFDAGGPGPDARPEDRREG